jgi:glutamate 5-kinase
MARLIEVVDDFESLDVSVGGAGSNRGSGGMSSKLTAARMASWAGVRAVIAPAPLDGVLAAAVLGEAAVGTTFPPHSRRLGARKLWIAFAVHPAGRIVVDDGARTAVVERGRSLLPAGVLTATGRFVDGDAIELADQSGHVFARGLVRADHSELAQMIGRRTEDLPEGSPTIVVHRDDLVVLASS